MFPQQTVHGTFKSGDFFSHLPSYTDSVLSFQQAKYIFNNWDVTRTLCVVHLCRLEISQQVLSDGFLDRGTVLRPPLVNAVAVRGL